MHHFLIVREATYQLLIVGCLNHQHCHHQVDTKKHQISNWSPKGEVIQQKRGTEFLLKDSLGSPFGVLSPWNEGNNIYKDWCMETTWKQHPKLTWNLQPSPEDGTGNSSFEAQNMYFREFVPLKDGLTTILSFWTVEFQGRVVKRCGWFLLGGSALILISRVFINMMQVF